MLKTLLAPIKWFPVLITFTIVISNSGGSQEITTSDSNYTPSADLATEGYSWTVRVHDLADNVSSDVSPFFTFTLPAESGASVYLPIVIRNN